MANMKDIAKMAGVSVVTVSRVVNNSANVGDETRKKVQKAIKELNYKPSRVAKRLRSTVASGNLLGVLIPDIQNPFYIDVLNGIEEIAYKNNYALIMCNFNQDEEKQAKYIDMLMAEAVDGMIVAPVNAEDEKIINVIESGLPIVCVDRGLKDVDVDVDVVLVDNKRGAFLAVEHIIKSGYKRIAYISGKPAIPSSKQREEGYISALNKYGIKIDKSIIKYGDSSHKSGVTLSNELLNSINPPDAIFTGNNLITLGALETIHKMGLKIPEEIAIVGFDDMYWSNSLNPPLTAVRQPAHEIGKRAIELLIQRIEDPNKSTVQMILNADLIQRKSC